MSGVVIVARLMKEALNVTKLVPVDRIIADELPNNTKLPAISILSVSSTDNNILTPNRGDARRNDRVQVTVVGATRADVRYIMIELRKALRDRVGTLAGRRNVAIHTDGAGPEFSRADPSVFMQTQDFRVTFTEDL